MGVDEHYADIANEYAEPKNPYDAKYHEKRYATAVELVRGLNGRLFDYGCGTGEMFRRLPHFQAEGCDLSSVMVEHARKRAPGVPISVGSLTHFLAQPGPFDLIIALNVLPYLSEDEECAFYAHARRIATHVLISHTNMLFDLVTMNRYTVDFYRKHFSGLVDTVAIAKLPRLLTNATHPPEDDINASERDILDKRTVDPFTYRPEGFSILKMRLLNFFPLPPAIIQSRADWKLAQPDFELTGTLGMLFSSQFQMLLKPT